MQPFHAIIRALPSTDLQSGRITIGTRTIESLIIPVDQQAMPLSMSFEDAATKLEELPRMFFEPDGSFVWVSQNDSETNWQIDGNLYDRAGSLVAIEVTGTCERNSFEQFLAIFRSADGSIMFELLREAAFVREEDFIAAMLENGTVK